MDPTPQDFQQYVKQWRETITRRAQEDKDFEDREAQIKAKEEQLLELNRAAVTHHYAKKELKLIRKTATHIKETEDRCAAEIAAITKKYSTETSALKEKGDRERRLLDKEGTQKSLPLVQQSEQKSKEKKKLRDIKQMTIHRAREAEDATAKEESFKLLQEIATRDSEAPRSPMPQPHTPVSSIPHPRKRQVEDGYIVSEFLTETPPTIRNSSKRLKSAQLGSAVTTTLATTNSTTIGKSPDILLNRLSLFEEDGAAVRTSFEV